MINNYSKSINFIEKNEKNIDTIVKDDSFNKHIINKDMKTFRNNSENYRIKFQTLPSKINVLKNCLFLKSKSDHNNLNMYILIKNKLFKDYLDITSLIKIKNEINYIKLLMINDKSDERLYENIIKIISLNKYSSKENHDISDVYDVSNIASDSTKLMHLKNYLNNS